MSVELISYHATLPRRCAGVTCRYDFEAYTEASEKMYRVFLRYAPVVMAVSCDEAFMELAEGTDPMEAATRVRRVLRTSLSSLTVGWEQLHDIGVVYRWASSLCNCEKLPKDLTLGFPL